MSTKVTFVALYGEKPQHFSQLILDSQQLLGERLGDAFQPYQLWQVHSTILGLERVNDFTYENLNFFQYRGESKEMDFAGFLNWIRSHNGIPFQIQIGGFEDRAYPFVTRGQKPYDRSFSLQHNKAVLMGWPILRKDEERPNLDVYPTTLHEIRRGTQPFNILHNYHRQLTDIDNDFYFRIGLLNSREILSSTLATVEKTIRQYLSQSGPWSVEVNLSNLSVVAYSDETLPKHSTKFWAIEEEILTASFIEELYKT